MVVRVTAQWLACLFPLVHTSSVQSKATRKGEKWSIASWFLSAVKASPQEEMSREQINEERTTPKIKTFCPRFQEELQFAFQNHGFAFDSFGMTNA